MSQQMVNNYSLIKLFPYIKIDAKMKNLLSHSKILGIQVYRKTRKIDITIGSSQIINKWDMDHIIYTIKTTYKLNDVRIHIKYRDIQNNDSYLENYYENIKYYLQKEFAICRTLLAESTCEHKDNTLLIKLKFGGSEFLKSNKCDQLIASLVKDEFGDKINIEFTDVYIMSKEKKEYLTFKEKNEAQAVSEVLVQVKNEDKETKNASTKVQTNLCSSIILGKTINDESTNIALIDQDAGRVIIEGDIFAVDIREIKGERYIVSFDITDYSSSITVKFFSDKEKFNEIGGRIKSGVSVKVRGEVRYDKYARELIIFAYDITQIQKQEKMDHAEQKRVELHLHTQMSAMDGVSSIKDLVARAACWGHPAVAITDHGVVQAYPEAYEAGKKNNIKIIYGIECYLVNDSIPIVYNTPVDESLDGDFVVFDIETTGLNAQKDKVTEIGAVKISNGSIVDRFQTFVNPEMSISPKITELTGITDDMVKDAPIINEALVSFLEFSKDCVLVAHNAQFDVGFIKVNARRLNISFDYCFIDTLELSRALFPELKRHRLNMIAKHLNVKLENHHRALDDAKATGEIFLKCIELLKEKNIYKLKEINNALSNQKDVKKMDSYHAVILVKDYVGLKNLYKIVSESHLNYFYKKPRVPKSLYMQYKEGLIIGSGCEAGELYRAILEGKPFDEVSKIVKFYDYLEIQPLANNQFLIENGTVQSVEQLKQINREIIKYGEKYNKPVVATCDVHFLDPHDEVFRRILMAGQGFSDADNQPPLYFRTTDEMLEEFNYLGPEKAWEVVVENTNKIAQQIDHILPIPDETFPPEIEGAEEEIKTLSINKAVEIYGNPLPKIVQERMDKELNSIIKNGFSVMYIIAQKLVWKSLSDGYLVGSRGSVGSSFVAFLTGITEVNALPAHYVCPHCKYSEFITDGSVGAGADMPDKDCPKCGNKFTKDGHDIPFETFLGFDGDKEPDIDLNFSGDYQPIAHKYTEELFGKGHVFRAGTIGTIAEKTAYGFVKKYLDERGKVVHNAEINRLVKGCTGVKRTTGQHPGGVMIVPRKNEIYEFCPVQRPADDINSNIITTHFDYHSISGRLLKLDILGHDDPTVIKMLEDLTGVNAQKIPIDDPKTMSIFTSTEALGIQPEDINSEVGTFAIPEFGTKFVRQMLIDTRPKTFAELVRISGLSHGTDVWLNNAQDLVRAGTATLSEVICTRDDIMIYLMHKGLPPKHAFKIMESVRKGKGLKEEDEAAMRANNVPEWYIESCKKIKYMFPKAHAVAYVTMAFRIAYFKVHYPEAFYTTYFTVRADDFDAQLMTNGVEKVKSKIKELEAKGNEISTKEKNVLTILEVCNEMYSRGIKFLPIDLYKSDAVKFINTKEGILPPLNALQGVGINAAKSIVQARQDGEFLSLDDLRIRAKISKTVIETLQQQGCLKDLPESSQLSLF
ncbi:MAG: polymerase subunit alpha, Gram-positive type [Clostridiales bacterium]|jgi:DNA polymerase-3 subunit alpha (Gram-positive type)|nr:polymerase subunit alpha, Gram-positive type [Clostridiales bacterium]MDK2932327.1 polymerase subunit alpha, Gram-positive type [Clostridiales bacterium]